jgi:membrane complex biogenesis BtpA family protein
VVLHAPGSRPLVGVVHLPPSLGYAAFPGTAAALELVVRDVGALIEGGIDGILLENDADEPHTIVVSKAAVAWLTRASSVVRARTRLPLGIGVQRMDWEAALAIAAAADLDFVRLDTFVDRVRMSGEIVDVDPRAVIALRSALGIDRVELWTDVHVKHADLLSAGSLSGSARAAVQRGSSAVLVTGDRTGQPPVISDLRAARAAAAPTPVLVGSGLTSANAAVLACESDGAVVGTALKSGDRIAVDRVKEVVSAWRDACASPR